MTLHDDRAPADPGELPAAEVDQELMKLLSDPLRARIVTLLAAQQLCTVDLAHATGALTTAVSNHLRKLREAGAVETIPSGRRTYYRLRPEVLERAAAQFSALARSARGATATGG